MDFGSNDIYIYSPFSLFVSVYAYASVCDFVRIVLLLPFVLGFSQSFFFLFSFLVYLSVLVIIGGFVFWFSCSLLSFFFYYLKKIYTYFFVFYFNKIFILFYFILSFSFFLSIFLPFILSHENDKLLVLQPGVRVCLCHGRAKFMTLVHKRPRSFM